MSPLTEWCGVCGRGVGTLHRPTCQHAGRVVESIEPVARRTDPPTSHTAATSARAGAGAIRANVLNTLRAAAKGRPGGMTDEELVAYFEQQGMAGTPSGIRTRRRELVDADPPLVIDSGLTRKTAAGRAARVWIARPNEGSST